ncbi:MAG: class I SAM-dependent RNA methyltransferase [Syntrophobacteraceae bacterium]|nr:hypothetical protein [Desulfobacteraceae bacterium]
MSDGTEYGPASGKAYLRHLKRYVQAPVHGFVAVTPPELSKICMEELSALGVEGLTITEAGVEFRGKLSACYQANLKLRTAGRVLCRLPVFRAGAAEELFHRAVSIPWELWLNPSIPVQVEPHVEYSRIEHEGVVSETVTAAIRRRYEQLGTAPPASWREAGDPRRQRIFVRLDRNRCGISLDTTGTHLHKRGYRTRHAGAPLRETLAAALLLKCGWTGDIPLVDGMCGSGTFPIEAALLARRLPPGLARRFLFQDWPSFQDAAWNHLCRKSRESALPRCPAPVIGVDLDPEALVLARENAEKAGTAADTEWEEADFFTFRPQSRKLPPGLLVLNPPYGKRLEGGGGEMYERLGSHLRSAFRGWRAAVIAPDRSLAARLRLQPARYWNLLNGGIPIVVAMARL